MNNDYKIEDQLAEKKSQSSCKQSRSRKIKKSTQKPQKQKTPKITNFFKKLKQQSIQLQQKLAFFNNHIDDHSQHSNDFFINSNQHRFQLKQSYPSTKHINKRSLEQQRKIEQLNLEERQLQHEEEMLKKQIQTIKSQEQILYDQTNSYFKKLRQCELATIKERYDILRQQKSLPQIKKIAVCHGNNNNLMAQPVLNKIKQVQLSQHESNHNTPFKQKSTLQIVQIQKKITQKEKIISKLSKSSKLTCFQRKNLLKDIQKLKVQKQYIINQNCQYLQKKFFAQKQKTCKFALMNWPLINKRYQILELVGCGGYSQVYKALNITNSQFVAVKLCSVAQMAQVSSEIYLKHLFRECQTHKQLKNDNIVKLFEVIQLDKTTFCMVLEFCEGPQLSKYLKRKGFIQEQQVKVIMFQIFQSLYYLNYYATKKIVHYDLKPQNIMFDHGLIKILDFGLTKHIEQQQSRAALTSLGMGTHAYLPPQIHQINQNDDRVLTNKVDIWSAGIIFYQLLYGKRPTMMNDIQQDSGNKNISEQTKSIIKSCLKLNPSQRINPKQVYFHPYFDQFQRKYAYE